MNQASTQNLSPELLKKIMEKRFSLGKNPPASLPSQEEWLRIKQSIIAEG